MNKGIRNCILFLVVLCGWSPLWAQHSLTIQVNSIPVLHKEDPVFVAGNFNGWAPGNGSYELKRKNGRLEIKIEGLREDVYEFKFTRGDWAKVSCLSSGADMSNQLVKLTADTTVVYSIEAWKDDFATPGRKHTASANVSVIDTAFMISQLGRTGRIWIYLPPSYKKSTKHYPVLYMQDGQNLFDDYEAAYGEWGIDEALDSIMQGGKNECIVVGIDNGPKRLNEYNPFDHDQFGPGEGKEYAAFVAETLKPFIDSRYRTLKDRGNTIVAGSSMGGLISYYIQLTYPGVFGKAGVFSPAFWTAPGIIPLTDSLAKKSNGKFFFYMGALEGEEYMNDMYRLMQELGSKSSSFIYAVTDAEGRHNEAAWRKWFPEFFRFMMADWTNYVIRTDED